VVTLHVDRRLAYTGSRRRCVEYMRTSGAETERRQELL
jgi:hypothetical protein